MPSTNRLSYYMAPFRVENLLIITLFARLLVLLTGDKTTASFIFMAAHALAMLLALKFVYNMIKDKLSLKKAVPLFIFATLLFYLVILYIANNMRPSSLDDLPVTLLVVCFLISSSDGSKASYQTLQLYFKVASVASAALIVALLFPHFYNSGVLILYTTNPNQAAIIYMAMFMNMLTYVVSKKRSTVVRILITMLCIGLFIGCCLTESRTSIACCIIAVIVYLLCKKVKKPPSSVLARVVIVSYALFPIIVEFAFSALGLDVSELLTGRDGIWEKVISSTIRNPLDAHFTESIISEGSYYVENLSAHNVFLELVWKYSLPTGILFAIFIYMIFDKTSAFLSKGKVPTMLFATFVACLLHMCFEATLISGALDFSLYIVLPLVLGLKVDFEEKKHE